MQRKKSLDIVKGIAIILVMYGHLKYTVVNMDTVYCWIYSFHMPLFIYVSGILTNLYTENKGKRLLAKIKKIIIPYIIANIGGFILQSFFHIQTQSIHQFLHGIIIGDNLISNLPTWYLLSYLWIAVFGICVMPMLNTTKKLVVADILAVLGVFVIAYCSNMQDFFRIKGAIVLLPFFITGYIVKKMELKVSWWGIIALFVIGYGTGRLNAIQSWRYITVGNGDICVPYFYLIAAGCTSIAMVELCKHFKKVRGMKILTLYGRHSMLIMCTHWVLGRVLSQYIEYGIGLFGVILILETFMIIIQECIVIRIKKGRKQHDT